jgi:hypothetical protein
MKKLVYFIIFAATALVACKSPESKVTGIELSPSSIELKVEQTYKLAVKYSPDGVTAAGTVTWSSSNEDVATVDSKGTVTAVLPGTAVITAKYENFTATCDVKVLTFEESLKITSAVVLVYESTGVISGSWQYPFCIAGMSDGVSFVDGEGIVGEGVYFEFITALELVDDLLQQSIIGNYSVYDGIFTPETFESIPVRSFEKGELGYDEVEEGYSLIGSWLYGVDAEGDYPIAAIVGESFNFDWTDDGPVIKSYDLAIKIVQKGEEEGEFVLSDETILINQEEAASVVTSSSLQYIKQYAGKIKKSTAVVPKNVFIKK